MLELYDCTLREGDQSKGAGFSLDDRLKMSLLLDELGIDYIELGWPSKSKEVFDSFRHIIPAVKRSKIVAFGSTSRTKNPEDDENLDLLTKCGARYACIFGKSDSSHVENQLRVSKQENLDKIQKSIEFLRKKGLKVFYDAEHFFDGFKRDREYAMQTILSAIEGGAERIVLCDTNGGTFTSDVKDITSYVKNELDKRKINSLLGLHLHDDRGLATASALVCLPHVVQVQGTINGVGERVGNQNLTTLIGNLDEQSYGLEIKLEQLKKVNDESFRLCGLIPDRGRPYVGDTAFAHCGGVHINGVMRDACYEHTNPARYGNKRVIILSSSGGSSSAIETASQFGMTLDKNSPDFGEKLQRLMEELSNNERAGYDLGGLFAEQFLLLDRHFGSRKQLFDVKAWKSESERYLNGGEGASFYGVCSVNGKEKLIDHKMTTDGGPVDAAFNTLKEMIMPYYPGARDLHLVYFEVKIAREREEQSTVRTEVWFKNGEEFSTVGVDKNIIGSAVEALGKGFRYHLLRKGNLQGRI